jgi:hypothetical protein
MHVYCGLVENGSWLQPKNSKTENSEVLFLLLRQVKIILIYEINLEILLITNSLLLNARKKGLLSHS